MSDEVKLAIIVAIPSTILAIAALLTAIKARRAINKSNNEEKR